MSHSKLTVRIALRIIVAIAFLLSIVVTSAAQTPSPTPALTARRVTGRPFPPAQYIPPHDYDQQNIKLDLRFDFAREQAIGTETITLSPTVKDLKRVDLDAAFMVFESTKLARGTPLTFSYDDKKENLSINLDRAYQPNDEITIVISYHTIKVPPERIALLGGGGLNFILPRADDPTRPKQAWTQGEAESNHFWFACFDHPNDFVTTEIVGTVEKPLTVVSNGKLINTKENSDGTRTFDWKIDAPHATYLTSVVVGEYKPVAGEYAGIPVLTYVYPNEFDEGTVTAARLPEMVRFFSEKTGVKYPYAKYAQTMARDFGGGMENISATTQTDNMIHDARTELDQTSDSLESHELAHQWFGDYLTCRSWSDIWLNESFATYFQAMWDEHHLGHDDFLYSDVKSNQDQYVAAWNRGQRRPIVTKHYTNPDAVFDTYAYPRGGAVLHMLRTFLGEDNWWRSLNHYLTKYAHQPVETAQLRIAIEETTGQPMDWFFDEWVYKMGHPVFRVTQTYDQTKKELTLKVRQEQKPDPDSQYPQVGFFQTPVDIEIGTATSTRVERVQIEPQEEQTFNFAVDAEPLLVGFDYNGTLIKEITFTKPTPELIYQLKNDKDVLGRIWALSQLTSRMKEEKTAAAEREAIRTAIAEAATGDQFWGTRASATTSLSGSKESKDALLAATKDSNATVRMLAVNSLAATKDPGLANIYLELINDRSYQVIHAASTALGQTKNKMAYDDNLLHLRGAAIVGSLPFLGHTAQWDTSALSSGQFITNVNRYAVDGSSTVTSIHRYAPQGPDGKNIMMDHWESGAENHYYNEPGVLKMDAYAVWPRKTELRLADYAESWPVNKKLEYWLSIDGHPIDSGKIGTWILGQAVFDVPVKHKKLVRFTIRTNRSPRTLKTLLLANARVIDGSGKEHPIPAGRITYTNVFPLPDKGKDYEGGPVRIAGNSYTDFIAAEPENTNSEAVITIDLAGLDARRFKAVLGGDWPVGDEEQLRKVVDWRTRGRDAAFLTVIEPYEDKKMIKKVTAFSANTLSVELTDGRIQTIAITGLGNNDGRCQVKISEEKNGKIIRTEDSNNP